MKLNSRYNFKEATLGKDFAEDKLKEFQTLIDRGISFVTISMPGVGASYFLKHLATRDFAFFIHVDMYSLPTLTQHEFFKLLFTELGGKPAKKTDVQLLQETRVILRKLSQEKEKIVIIFNRFDQLKKEFTQEFLSQIQSLTSIDPDKIVLIFTATKPLYELAPGSMSGGNLNFYSENLYFKPYSIADLRKILTIDPGRLATKENLEKFLELSGGHNQLLHIFLSSQKEQLLLDQFVKLQFKELLDYLTYQQRKQVTSIASHPFGSEPQGRRLERLKGVEGSIDEYLLGVGMVKKTDTGYQLFTPLLKEYIKTYFTPKLPLKEAKLFNLLRRNIGKVTSKYEIFESLWEKDPDKATDWALDALIYRLRKHAFMKAHEYVIESQKKQGYTLIQT